MPSGVRISFPDKLYNNPIKQNSKQVTLQYPCNSGSTCYPYEVTFSPGTYTIECYGAGYANNPKYKSYGAYTKGTITFIQTKTLYFYIGASGGIFNVIHPNASLFKGTYPNGATDVRTDKGNYYDFFSLKTRIMVAGAGGNSDDFLGIDGHGEQVDQRLGAA